MSFMHGMPFSATAVINQDSVRCIQIMLFRLTVHHEPDQGLAQLKTLKSGQ